MRRLISQSKEVKIGVYCARKSGLSYVASELEEFLKNGGSLSFLIGFRSTPDILDELKKLEEIRPVRIGLYVESTFHSKMYVFRLMNDSVTSIVGSSNLTGSALSTNIEANVELQDFGEPEKTYDRLFEESEKNRKVIERRLKKWEKTNSRIDRSEDKLEIESRETIEGKSVTRLWKMLDKRLGRIDEADLREKLRSTWRNTEKRIVTKYNKKPTRNGKKAWLRYRLDYIIRKAILDPAQRLNRAEKEDLFRSIAEYSLRDSEIRQEHFSRKPFLRRLISIVKRRRLEKTISRALWGRREYGRRLFRKITKYLSQTST